MSNLLFDIAENLTLNDIEVLNNLIKDDALSRFSAKPKQIILEETSISESTFRKSVARLEATILVRLTNDNRKQRLYATVHGQDVFQILSERGSLNE